MPVLKYGGWARRRRAKPVALGVKTAEHGVGGGCGGAEISCESGNDYSALKIENESNQVRKKKYRRRSSDESQKKRENIRRK
jgi:hypothetical protein